ncbi:MAG: hypothetical protein V4631_15120 [Pseudomonadota bacterium]
MQARSIIQCALVLALAGAPAAGAVRIGELVVREGNAGVPCFTIPEAEERRGGAPDFQSISVGEAGARTALWSMTMPKARTFPVSFRMCIPYAGRLPVLPQTAAATLQPDRPYDVTIEVRAPRQAGGPRSYRARFCLVRQGPGALRVRNIGAGNLDGKSRRACGG